MKLKINCILNILILILSLTSAFFSDGGGSKYLYEGDKSAFPVIEHILDEPRPSFLYDVENVPRIVEFYSPWCGHCIHYKPEYIKLAKSISEIASTPVKIYAVSCTAHSIICKDQDVHSYPTVKLFKAGSINGEVMSKTHGNPEPSKVLKNLNVEVAVKKPIDKKTTGKIITADEMAGAIIKRNTNRKSKVETERNDAIGNQKTEKGLNDVIIKERAENARNDAIIRQKAEAARNDVIINQKDEAARNDAIIRQKAETERNLNPVDPVKEPFYFTFAPLPTIVAKPIIEVKKSIITAPKVVVDPKINPVFQRQSGNDIFHDAALSFRFSLKTGIFMEEGPLSEEKAIALKDWITIINRTWPSYIDMSTHRLTTEILQNFDTVVQDEKILKRIVSNYSVKDADWSASCKKGTSYLGFTCGLWQLFHIMTVGVIEWNHHSVQSEIITSTFASDTLRNFVANFFACSVCQQHFLQMYDSCSFNRCTRLTNDKSPVHSNWKQLPLWLWETHNDVNVRLKVEGAESENKLLTDTEKYTARWPSPKECNPCWQNEVEWKDDIVLEHIMKYYWPGRKMSIESKPVISSIKQISTMPAKKRSNGWSFLIIFLLTFVFGWLWLKKRRKSVSGRHKKIDKCISNKELNGTGKRDKHIVRV